MLQTVLQTELQTLPYTFQRNGIYYLRYRVPKVVQKATTLPPMIRQSLHTKSPRIAQQIVAKVISQFDDLRSSLVAKQIENTIQMGLITCLTGSFELKFEGSSLSEERKELSAFMKEYPQHFEAPLTKVIESVPDSTLTGISLSESFELYFAWKEKQRNKNGTYGLTKESLRSRTASFQKLLLVIGDIDIGSVTKQHILETLEVIDNMPRLNQLPYSRDKRLEVWIEEARNRKIPDHHLVASNQAGESLKDYQSLFSTFLTKTKGCLKDTPTRYISVDVETLSYAGLSRKQMAEVTKYWEAQPSSDYKWIILLAAYSGARRGDIFKLKLQNVLFDFDCKRHYLFIEKGKSDAATRKIPLHNKLIKLGFLDFFEESKKGQQLEEKLFRAFKTDHYITSKFRDTLDVLGVPKLNDENRRFSFHSMRHSCITHAVKSNELQLVQRVVGHAISGAGITGKYIGEFELSDVLNVVDCIDW